mgnify:CR=1 FL=1
MTVVEADGDRLGDFYRIYGETARRAGFLIRAKSAYRDIWDAFGPADWYPGDHPKMPDIVAHGQGAGARPGRGDEHGGGLEQQEHGIAQLVRDPLHRAPRWPRRGNVLSHPGQQLFRRGERLLAATGHDQNYGQFIVSTGPYMWKGADQVVGVDVGADHEVVDDRVVAEGHQRLDVCLDGRAALLELRNQVASGRWDLVVVDCAPTGETLRLLSLPEAGEWWLEHIFPLQRKVAKMADISAVAPSTAAPTP